ncbi:MAG: PVC-type heme-binding CxxCH protein [Planctomycetota bacterium]|nr:PVC-type heme-binding CxxCH protein [Planctomycetota bacterium]
MKYAPLLSVCVWGLAVSATSVIRSEDLAGFEPPPLQVADGFVIELAAAPPLVRYPMMACFDDRGRLFIAESSGKNLAKDALLEQRCRFIRMLEDTDGDGRFDKSTIFADRMVMPEGALWHRGSLYVVSSPYLWRLQDTDDDGVADVREKLVGYLEFNGKANQHGAYLGPNGRIYFSGGTFGYDLVGSDGKPAVKGSAAGVFSCLPDGTDVEVVGTGGINPVEVVFTPEGELLTTCAIFDNIEGRHDALIHWVRGATAAPQDFRPPVLPQTGHRLPALSRWGQVAPSGMMRYRSAVFGPDYRDTYFSTQFNTAKVMWTRLQRRGASFASEDQVFLSSTSRDFHPTDVLEDADGSLVVIDTGGWFRISCPKSEVAKPGIPGAIYRIRRVNGKTPVDPLGSQVDWSHASAAELSGLLDDSRVFVRDRAREALVTLGDSGITALEVTPESTVVWRRNVVWTLSRIATTKARARIIRFLADEDVTVRQAAVRSVGVLKETSAVEALSAMLLRDEISVRRAAATALGQIGSVDSIPALLRAARQNGDTHFRHSLVFSLIEMGHFGQTLAGLLDTNPQVQLAALTALDRIDSERLTEKDVAPLLKSDDPAVSNAALELIASREGWTDQIIEFLALWLQETPVDAAKTRIAQGALVAYSSDLRVEKLVSDALGSAEARSELLLPLLEALARRSEVPDSWVEPLRQLLSHRSAAVRRQVIQTVTALNTNVLDRALRKMGRDPANPQPERCMAWSCLAQRGLPLPDAAVQLLADRTGDAGASALDRLSAARSLGLARLKRGQLDVLLEVVSRASLLELPALLEAFVRVPKIDDRLGTQLVASLERSPGLSTLSTDRLRRVLRRLPQSIRRTAYQRLEPKADRKGDRIARLNKIESGLLKGDAARGKALFYAQRSACSGCHRVNKQGGSIGPDLSTIARVRTRRDLLESVVYPGMTIANGFETYAVLTEEGRILEGVIQRATSRAIVLRDAQRAETTVYREEIQNLSRQTSSIMPEGLDQTLTTQQLSDLLAFLLSLR